MLISVTLRNILSYDSETTFSMIAGKITKQHKNHVTKILGLPVLRGAIIYGPNASGKSNLLNALSIFREMISADTCRLALGSHFKFAHRSLSERVMAWKLVYSKDGHVFRYVVETNGLVVALEQLDELTKDGERLLFRRTKKGVEFGELLQADAWYANRSFRRDGFLAAKFIQDGLFDRCTEIANADLVVMAVSEMSDFEIVSSGAAPSPLGLVGLMAIDEFKKFLKRLLKVADLGIEDIAWRTCTKRETAELVDRAFYSKKVADEAARFLEYGGSLWAVIISEGKPHAFEIRFIHQGVALPMGDESEGTVRLFQLSVFLYALRTREKVWFVDEIDCHLHPYLVYRVLKEFMNLPETKAQIVVTAHDTTLMSHDIWRTDEVWFAEKRADGSSSLYSLYQYTPRFDKKLEKGYRQGLYGAIPHMGGEMLNG